MFFRQLFDQASSSYTYLLADEASREAVLIDPVFEQHGRDAALLRELGLTLRCTLDTHCHADHVTGAWLMHHAFGSRIGLSPAYGASHVHLALAGGVRVTFGREALEVRETPGHTAGDVSLVTGDHRMVFTGDALMIRAAGRTDFQEGDASRLYHSIREQLFSLPDHCLLYPAHDYLGRTVSTIGEEKRFNPRIGGGAREEDFVGYMRNMALPPPKSMDASVPANLRCGEPESMAPPSEPDWGPVVISYAGVPEVAPEWVADHRQEVRILDVRSAGEFEGDLGHIEGATLIPLDELRGRAASLPGDRPLIVVCQTGRRSAMGTGILGKAGFTRVANLAGGMVRWRALGLPS